VSQLTIFLIAITVAGGLVTWYIKTHSEQKKEQTKESA
jgi:hypothetical protein